MTCLGVGCYFPEIRSIQFEKEYQILHRPEFSEDFGWEAGHMFCGAFGGWSQALKWISKTSLGTVVGREIFLDHDVDVMDCWAEKYGRPYVKLPLSKIKVWDAAAKFGILGDRSWLHALTTQVKG